MVGTLIRNDVKTHQENLIEKTVEGIRSLNHIMRKFNGQRLITAEKTKIEKKNRTKIKSKQ